MWGGGGFPPPPRFSSRRASDSHEQSEADAREHDAAVLRHREAEIAGVGARQVGLAQEIQQEADRRVEQRENGNAGAGRSGAAIENDDGRHQDRDGIEELVETEVVPGPVRKADREWEVARSPDVIMDECAAES